MKKRQAWKIVMESARHHARFDGDMASILAGPAPCYTIDQYKCAVRCVRHHVSIFEKQTYGRSN